MNDKQNTIEEAIKKAKKNGYELCPECLGHGEVIAYVPMHPEDMPDYFVECPNGDCEYGFVKIKTPLQLRS